MKQQSYSEYLDQNLPDKISLNLLKDTILEPTNDFLKDYFSDAVQCMLIWNELCFLEKNFSINLPTNYRNQLIGLISLCRYPIRIEFLKSLNSTPPFYQNEYLHQSLESSKIKFRIIGHNNYYSIKELDGILPYPITKNKLANHIFQGVAKTSKLTKNQLTPDVLMTFGLSIDEYKSIRIFDDFTRIKVIGLISYFKIPLKKRFLKAA